MNFRRALTVIVSSTFIAQVINVISIPLITHLYSPREYKYFALLINFSSIFLPFVTLKMDMGMISFRESLELNNYFAKALGLSFTISFIFLPIFLLMTWVITHDSLLKSLQYSFCLLIMLIIQSICVYTVAYGTKMSDVRLISLTSILQNSGTFVVQLIFGFFKLGVFGLIFGYLTGRLVSNSLIWRKYRLNRLIKIERIGFSEIEFRINSMQKIIYSGFMDSCNLALPILICELFFRNSYSGLLNMAFTILIAPVTLIGGSIANTAIMFSKSEISWFESSRMNVRKKFVALVAIILIATELVLSKLGFFGLILGNKWSGIDLAILFLAIPISLQITFSLQVTRLFLQNDWTKYLRYSVHTFILGSLFTFAGYLMSFNWYVVGSLWSWGRLAAFLLNFHILSDSKFE